MRRLLVRKSKVKEESTEGVSARVWRRRGILSLLGGLLIMLCLGTVYAWSLFRLPVQKVYGVGVTASGLPYMVSLASYALSMLLSGRYLAKLPFRRAARLGAVLVASGWILASYSTALLGLTFSYGLLIGAGVGLAYGVPMELVALFFPKRRGLVVGLVLLGFGMSPLLTAPLVSRLLASYSLQASFFILGIFFLLVLFILSFFLYPLERGQVGGQKDGQNRKEGKEEERERNDRPALWASPSFRSLYFSFLIASSVGLMVIGMTSLVARRYLGLSLGQAALLLSFFAIFNGLGRPLFGYLTDRWGSVKAARLSYLLLGLASLLILVGGERPSLLFFVISFSLFWLNLGGWLAIAPATTLAFYGLADYPRSYGILFTAYGLGAVLGVLFSGLLLDFLEGLGLVFFFVFLLVLLGGYLSRGLEAQDGRR